ncbi:MAG TPA: carboxypeptidase-like regulatory domain-containing protein, partial [Candidatus Thermoplasmatota archaeon]
MRAELRSGLVLLVFLAAAFSGCAKAKAVHVDPDPYAQPEGFDDNTGSVVGTVVDEEFVPLKDAIVGFIDPYQAAKTDEAGRFEIGLVLPAQRNFYVIHLGHQSAGKRIEIKAREATEVLFVLKVLPIEVPWVHVIPKK